MLEHQQI